MLKTRPLLSSLRRLASITVAAPVLGFAACSPPAPTQAVPTAQQAATNVAAVRTQGSGTVQSAAAPAVATAQAVGTPVLATAQAAATAVAATLQAAAAQVATSLPPTVAALATRPRARSSQRSQPPSPPRVCRSARRVSTRMSPGNSSPPDVFVGAPPAPAVAALQRGAPLVLVDPPGQPTSIYRQQ
ncbi:MAG: hypothetical protein JO352_01155 [Chloroflexi bacterium]|nr:hypothetical protein [Chloroflexota bacterium]